MTPSALRALAPELKPVVEKNRSHTTLLSNHKSHLGLFFEKQRENSAEVSSTLHPPTCGGDALVKKPPLEFHCCVSQKTANGRGI